MELESEKSRRSISDLQNMKVIVTRKRIKNIYLRVNEAGEVEVSAPPWYTDRQIREFVLSKSDWIAKAQGRAERRREGAPSYLDHPELKEAARRELRARLEKRVPLMEARTGLKCSGWAIRDMKTRWGSCNIQTHHITFNLRLVNRTDEELDYIILHELCHTVYRYHDRNFWGLVEKFMPDWQVYRRKLRY